MVSVYAQENRRLPRTGFCVRFYEADFTKILVAS
jgi:hypothetical protein